MSDDEDYYDDEDYFYIDDGPVAEADDLAEHTMHSPVWGSYEQVYDSTEYLSEWDNDSDEYFDGEHSLEEEARTAKSNGRKLGAKRQSTGRTTGNRKRRKLETTSDIPDLSLGESLDSESVDSLSPAPIVIWKKAESSPRIPTVNDGEGEKVALLKDWREIFGTKAENRHKTSTADQISPIPQRRSGIAVVIERRPSETALPNKVESKPMPSRSRIQPQAALPTKSKTKTPFLNPTKSTTQKSALASMPATKTPAPTQRQNGASAGKQRAPEPPKDDKLKPTSTRTFTANNHKSEISVNTGPGTRKRKTVAFDVPQPSQTNGTAPGNRKRKAEDEMPELEDDLYLEAADPKSTLKAKQPSKGKIVGQRNGTKTTAKAVEEVSARNSKRVKRG